jgi:hypothetical protein
LNAERVVSNLADTMYASPHHLFDPFGTVLTRKEAQSAVD